MSTAISAIGFAFITALRRPCAAAAAFVATVCAAVAIVDALSTAASRPIVVAIPASIGRDYRQVGREPLHCGLHAGHQHGRHVRKPGNDGHERLPERRHRFGEVALALSVRDDVRVRLLVLAPASAYTPFSVSVINCALSCSVLHAASAGVERVLLRGPRSRAPSCTRRPPLGFQTAPRPAAPQPRSPS